MEDFSEGMMNNAVYQKLIRATTTSQIIAKLDAASRELIGGPLLVLMRQGEALTEVYPQDSAANLPEFCQVLRSSAAGRQRCATCRSLVVFGTCYQGPLEYTCHGGISVFATPVRMDSTGDQCALVLSCPLADPDRRRGWQRSGPPARPLGIDLRRLRGAYGKLPGRTPERARMALMLIDLAAAALGELCQLPAPAEPNTLAEDTDLQALMHSALFVSNDSLPEITVRHDGQKLAQMVIQMVSRNPGQPFSVAKIAATVSMTPNYFSTLFHQHAGIKFSAFLTEKRLTLARKLLRDLSLNINQVAQRSGFRDSSYFARQFKKATGMTPRQWRDAL